MALTFSVFVWQNETTGEEVRVDLHRKVHIREKTETRRLAPVDRWKVGETYAVKAARTAGGPSRFFVTKVWEERLSKITEEGIQREGLAPMSPEEFVRGFRAMHVEDCPDDTELEDWDPMVTVIQFYLMLFTRKMALLSPKLQEFLAARREESESHESAEIRKTLANWFPNPPRPVGRS